VIVDEAIKTLKEPAPPYRGLSSPFINSLGFTPRIVIPVIIIERDAHSPIREASTSVW
jgi:hypothetical protein